MTKTTNIHGTGEGNLTEVLPEKIYSVCGETDTKIRALLQSIVDAYDAGCVQLSSQDIQFDDENPPHPWHEEWLSDVRTTLALHH